MNIISGMKPQSGSSLNLVSYNMLPENNIVNNTHHLASVCIAQVVISGMGKAASTMGLMGQLSQGPVSAAPPSFF